MKAKKINVYQKPPGSAPLFLTLGLVFFLIGILGIIYGDKYLPEKLSDVFFPYFFGLGSVFCFARWHDIKYGKHYDVRFSDDEKTINLPLNIVKEALNINDIEKLDIKYDKIEIVLKNGGIKIIEMTHLLYEERKKLTAYFEAIKENLNSDSTLSPGV